MKIFFYLLAFASFSAAREKPNLLIITGEPEYSSQYTLPALGEIAREYHGMEFNHLRAEKTGQGHTIPGLTPALKEADLILLYLRFLVLPRDQVEALASYMDKGNPYLAVRTSTHPFRYPKDSPHAALNESFPIKYFGTSYRGHHGHKTSQLNFVMAARHPVMRGVEYRFWTPDFVYGSNPLAVNCTPLIIGQALDGLKPVAIKQELGNSFLNRNHCRVLSEQDEQRTTGTPHPVVWTIEPQEGRGRGFVSTIGARKSFENEGVQRMFINALYWCLGREDEIPENGSILAK